MDPKAALRAWIDDNGLVPAQFASRISYDRGNFHRILHGAAWPSIELAHRIEKATQGKIAMALWAEAKAAA